MTESKDKQSVSRDSRVKLKFNISASKSFSSLALSSSSFNYGSISSAMKVRSSLTSLSLKERLSYEVKGYLLAMRFKR